MGYLRSCVALSRSESDDLMCRTMLSASPLAPYLISGDGLREYICKATGLNASYIYDNKKGLASRSSIIRGGDLRAGGTGGLWRSRLAYIKC